MMRTLLRITLHSVLLLFLYSPPLFADTTVGGRISADTTWTLANSPYIATSAVQVYGTATTPVTLTIEPGVVVKFNQNTGLFIGDVNSAYQGALYAVGTAAAPILFTSNQTTPTAGYWNGIIFYDRTVDASTTLSYVTVEYGGYTYGSNLYMYNASPTITNSTIRNSSGYGIYLNVSNSTIQNTTVNGGTYGIYGSGSPTITNSTLTNTSNYGLYFSSGAPVITGSTIGKGLYLNSSSGTVTGNTFVNTTSFPIQVGANLVGTVGTNNTIQNIQAGDTLYVLGGQISTSGTWKNLGLTYIVTASIDVYSTSNPAPVLTIEPGVVVKFNQNTSLNIGSVSSSTYQGALYAVGTGGSPILFTSNQATPTAGYWWGIVFYDGTVDASTTLSYVTVEYGGYAPTGYIHSNLTINSASPTITNSTIRNSSNYGIYLNGSNPTIQNTTIDGGTYGVYGSGSPTITNSTITNTSNYGLYLVCTTCAPVITGSTIGKGLYLNSNSGTVTGNTFTNSTSYPIQVGANLVGNVVTNNTIQNIQAGDTLNVLGGQISTSGTWKSLGLTYIVTASINVYSASNPAPVLTIEPGVVMKFNQNTGLYIGYVYNGAYPGALYAVGTTSAPILFTSNQATPTAGYWSGIVFYDGTVDASTTLSYVTVEYGGYAPAGYIASNLNINNASPTITNSTIRNSTGYGIYLNVSSPTIQSNVITNNGTYGIYDPSGLAVISGNTITGSGSYPARMGITQTGNVNTYGTNGSNAVEVVGYQVAQNLTMKNNGVPYIMTSSISVYGTTTTLATLTIEPGVIMKFNSSIGLTIGSGSNLGALNAVGTSSAPILFTSNQATPTPGYWPGINFNSGTVSTNTILNFVTVEYGGSGTNYYNANVIMNAPISAIQNSTIRNSAGSGIYLYGIANSLAIMGSSITGNKWGIYSYGSNPIVSNTQIRGNTTAGVTNASTTMNVDARSVWWGSYTGPRHSSNPNGTGDIISDRVVYSPWLYQPPGSSFTISNVNVLPSSFNPIGSYTTFTGSISAVSDWTIVIKDANQATIRTFTGHGTVINQQWSGENDQAVKVADGIYSYTMQAVNSSTGELVIAPQGNLTLLRALPIALIDSVSDNQMLTCGSTISVTGTAADSTDFTNYTLDYGVGDSPSSWTVLQTSTTQVTNGQFSTWNTASLPGNLYTLRLRVADTASNIAIITKRVRFLCVQNAAVSEGFISPNGDNVKDTTTVSSTVSYPSTWTLTLKDSSNTTVRTYTGTGTTMTQIWDGRNTQNTVVPDGNYTYQVDAVSTETSVQAASVTGVVVVDTTMPTAQITAPAANSTLFNAVQIVGNALDSNFNNFKVEYGPTSGAGPWNLISSATTSVSNGTLSTWTTNDQTNSALVQNGDYLLRLTVTDRAGNSAVNSVPVSVSNLVLSNIGVSSNMINTEASETTSIFFTINSSATVTISIIPENQGPTGTPVYQTGKVCAAGACMFTWDGKNNSGIVVPDEAYLYTIAASDGTKTDSYSPAAPTGAGAVTCTGDTYDLYRNDPLTVSYTVNQLSRINIIIYCDYYIGTYKVMDAYPRVPGSYTFDWDGRNADGKMILGVGGAATCTVASLMPENTIVTSGNAVKITGFKTDPYGIHLSLGQFTRIGYTLSKDANVTVKLKSPSGTILTLVNNQLQTAGAQEFIWYGTDPADTTGKKELVTAEGDYMVSIQAVNPATGISSTTRGNLRIGY
jgi:parallel beta-helix repeat protein